MRRDGIIHRRAETLGRQQTSGHVSLSGRWTNEIRGREEGDQSRGRSRRRSRRSSDGTRQNDGIIQMEFTKRGSCFELDQNWGSGSYGRYFLCVVRLFFSFLASSRFHHLFSSNNTIHRGFLIGEGSKFFFLSSPLFRSIVFYPFSKLFSNIMYTF